MAYEDPHLSLPSPPSSGAVEYKDKLSAALVELGCTQNEVRVLPLVLGHGMV